jgi:hypothetical protein
MTQNEKFENSCRILFSMIDSSMAGPVFSVGGVFKR